MKVLLFPAFTDAHESSLVETRFKVPLVQRSGSASCWVRWQESDFSVCVPKSVWLKNFSTQGRWLGYWQLSSPLLNPPSSFHERKKINATFHVLAKVQTDSHFGLFAQIGAIFERQREQVAEFLEDHLAIDDDHGVFKKLLLGESRPSDEAAFLRGIGFVHLFSTSGIHLAILSACVAFFSAYLGQFFQLPLSLTMILSRILGSSLWCWGWMLTGFKPSLLRPIVLMTLRRSSRTFGFRWRTGTALILTVLIDLLLSLVVSAFQHQPLSSFDWDQGRAFYLLALSGSAVSTGHWEMCFCSWLFVALWEDFHSGLIAVFTPLLSWLTLSLISIVIYPSLILLSVFRSDRLLVLIHPFFKFSNWSLGTAVHLAFLPGNVWVLPPHLILVGVLAATLILLSSNVRFRILSALALASIVLIARFQLTPSSVSATVIQLDVGQGDGALVKASGPQHADRSGLIDTGSKKALSDSQWMRVLASQNLTELGWIGLTHLDEDHSGGAIRLARLLRIHCLSTSEAELSTPRGVVYEQKLRALGVLVPRHLSQCVPFPSYEPEAATHSSANENMSAFLIPLEHGFYLSAGDATEKDEMKIGSWATREIEELNSPSMSSRILKISHHGSNTSSNPEFLKMIQPTEAWISVGVGNHYGHPSPWILDRIEALKIPLRRTDQSGAITLEK